MLNVPSTFSKKGNVHVIIETPKGSRNKYSYDAETGCFKLKKILPSGMVFPLDFGFIPGTKGQDGDPLDVLVIMEKHTYPGCLLECRIIGIIEATQKEKGDKKVRNDRLIAFPIDDLEHYKVKTLENLDHDMLSEIIQFFKQYNRVEHKKFEAIGYKNAPTAIRAIKKSVPNIIQ